VSFRECRYTAQDGLSLYYREYGAPDAPGTPVLCLAGLTRNSRDFHRVATRLCAERRVICPDYRGRGRSDYDADKANYQPATYLHDLRHLLAVVGAAPVIVIGTSLGGVLAMAMSAMMPTALAGVVLNDVGPKIDRSGLRRIIDYIGADRPHPDWTSAAKDLRVMFPTLSLQGDAQWEAAARATWRRGADGLLHFDWDVALAEPLRDDPELPDLWPLFGGLRPMPVLAIRGALSDVLSAETFAAMARSHPGIRQVTVPGVGHVPSLAEPEAEAAIDAFIAAIDAEN
jgi:pimeloyl-ACP methyl ester carboxylesterase